MTKKYIELANKLIKDNKVIIVINSKCSSRTHAHCDGTRRICKWKCKNSVDSLFTIAHEIGHIRTKTSNMRRCESEYYATIFALQELDKLNIKVPSKIIKAYQDYIYMELDRGLRRGGLYYPSKENLNVNNYKNVKLKLKKIPKNF